VPEGIPDDNENNDGRKTTSAQLFGSVSCDQCSEDIIHILFSQLNCQVPEKVCHVPQALQGTKKIPFSNLITKGFPFFQ
jgi:hypothetical protein